MKPHLYINSKGYFVTRHSYSGSDSFNYCARKYYLERVQGWTDKIDRAARWFGIALEAGVTFWHQHRQDSAAAVAEFVRLWVEHKEKPYVYSKPEKDWACLNITGQELLRLYFIRYPKFPFIVNNPQDFQVQTNFEVFPGTKLAGIEFTSYIDLIAQLRDTFEPIIIDIKTSAKDVPELTVLDPQLRSYSWAKRDMVRYLGLVAFLWFRKMGREISKGDKVTFLDAYAGFEPGMDAIVMLKDDFGIWVALDERVIEQMNVQFIGESKAVKAARLQYIEINGKHVVESAITKQRVQFKMATITPESAEDIGRSIKRDVINIAAANEKEFWPMQSGVRFPNEKCPMCAMRGICAEKPELRDTLVTRKQMDEFDFGKESE
jgi:hypothetical protein